MSSVNEKNHSSPFHSSWKTEKKIYVLMLLYFLFLKNVCFKVNFQLEIKTKRSGDSP